MGKRHARIIHDEHGGKLIFEHTLQTVHERVHILNAALEKIVCYIAFQKPLADALVERGRKHHGRHPVLKAQVHGFTVRRIGQVQVNDRNKNLFP